MVNALNGQGEYFALFNSLHTEIPTVVLSKAIFREKEAFIKLVLQVVA